ncbi:MAG: hypothetical protein FJ118_07635 [Deltaproteobacteria bacterium]|nr:hypothetical protein [Deltaproteobacteria bacterium]
MVLGSFVQDLTYPKSVYYSTTPYGFFYIRRALAMPQRFWVEDDDKWLASLYGLTYEKRGPPAEAAEPAGWEEYVLRIESYLKKGAPVQTYLGWSPRAEDESRGEIVTPRGLRAFWWEGLTKKFRPDMHSFVVVGLDRAGGSVRMNLPMAGWSGQEKNMTRPLTFLRRVTEGLRPEFKYVTIAYLKTSSSSVDDASIGRLVSERARKKVAGDPGAYHRDRPERHLFGLPALRAFRDDLEPRTFFSILNERVRRQNISPLEVLALLKLVLYQQAFMTSLASEYLEQERMIDELEWLGTLSLLYRKLYLSHLKLFQVVRENEHKDTWLKKGEPALREMRRTVDEIVVHFEKYLRSRPLAGAALMSEK